MSNQLATLQPQTFEQMMRYAELVAKSALVPKDYQGKPHDCLIAMQWATELGLNPLQGLQNIAVINGRPSLWGDMLPALVKNHPSYEWMKETIEKNVDGALLKAVCIGKRKGHPEPEIREFSVHDAQKANLWGKAGPWTLYPQRMLQMRARAWLCRDLWSDALRGLQVAEEMQDAPVEATLSDPKAEKRAAHEAACEKYSELIDHIRAQIKRYDEHGDTDALYTIAESWYGIPQEDQMVLYSLAPRDGGIWTTHERKILAEQIPKYHPARCISHEESEA